jgi:hypothetical protein
MTQALYAHMNNKIIIKKASVTLIYNGILIALARLLSNVIKVVTGTKNQELEVSNSHFKYLPIVKETKNKN